MQVFCEEGKATNKNFSLLCKAVEKEADILVFAEYFKLYFLEQKLVIEEERQSKKCEHLYFPQVINWQRYSELEKKYGRRLNALWMAKKQVLQWRNKKKKEEKNKKV